MLFSFKFRYLFRVHIIIATPIAVIKNCNGSISSGGITIILLSGVFESLKIQTPVLQSVMDTNLDMTQDIHLNLF